MGAFAQGPRLPHLEPSVTLLSVLRYLVLTLILQVDDTSQDTDRQRWGSRARKKISDI
jgi:hypothetical protein